MFSNASAVVGPQSSLGAMIRGRRYPSPQGQFLDRRLKASERRHVQVRADLGRDADAGTGIGRFVEPRFGAGARLPQGARAAADGGLSKAASGNLAIVAVTSWSRARAYQATTCAVPVGGAAPISFVTLRRLGDVRPIAAAFVQYLTAARGAAAFRHRGMLLAKEEWPAVPQPSGVNRPRPESPRP